MRNDFDFPKIHSLKYPFVFDNFTLVSRKLNSIKTASSFGHTCTASNIRRKPAIVEVY